MRVAFNKFVRRQTAASSYTHWDLTDTQMLRLIEINFDQAKEGYREGILKVAVPPYGFYHGIVKLQPGYELVGSFESRFGLERPRKVLRAKRQQLLFLSDDDDIPIYEEVLLHKKSAIGVDIILYHHDVLAEDGDDTTGATWEIVSVNGRDRSAEIPIHPLTLIANHFKLDGGTSTKMSANKFEGTLKQSVEYWKDYAMLEAV